MRLKRKIELLEEIINITYQIYDRCGIEDLISFSKKGELSKEDLKYLRDLDKEISNKK